jgi:hypothetical protein
MLSFGLGRIIWINELSDGLRSRELTKCKLDSVIQWECRRSEARAVAPNLQGNTHFSMDRGMRIMN